MYTEWKSFTDHSFPYLTGNSFAVQCKHIWNYDNYKINPYKNNDWVFVKTDYVGNFFKSSTVPDSFVLFTHNSDYPINDSYKQFLEDKRVRIWFAQNADFNHPKLKPIPIGIANAGYSHGDIQTLNKVRSESDANNTKTSLFYANFSLNTNVAERRKCLEKTGVPLAKDINGGWDGFAGCYHLPNTYEGYLRETSKACFALSPRGNGLDCHRTWEALYVNTIPIVTKSLVVEEHKDFPIVILNDWNDFNSADFTTERYKEIWGNFNTGKLHMDNYLKRLTEKYGI